MRILFGGDVVGRSGRDVVTQKIPLLRQHLQLDMVIINAENMAGGFGLTGAACDTLFQHGVDVITSGNHMWDEKEIIPYIGRTPNLIRPANYPLGAPGQGSVVWSKNGKRVLVINVMGRLFMDTLDDPFQILETCLAEHTLGKTVDAIIVDVHAEATSEKMAMAWMLDGRVSLVVGTHTHIPTADARILNEGTAYQTDAGMCGDYQSIVGMQIEAPLFRFRNKRPYIERMKAANGPATFCGTLVETDDATGKALSITPVRIGPHLSSTMDV